LCPGPDAEAVEIPAGKHLLGKELPAHASIKPRRGPIIRIRRQQSVLMRDADHEFIVKGATIAAPLHCGIHGKLDELEVAVEPSFDDMSGSAGGQLVGPPLSSSPGIAVRKPITSSPAAATTHRNPSRAA
jgi:hypothetical protein